MLAIQTLTFPSQEPISIAVETEKISTEKITLKKKKKEENREGEIRLMPDNQNLINSKLGFGIRNDKDNNGYLKK